MFFDRTRLNMNGCMGKLGAEEDSNTPAQLATTYEKERFHASASYTIFLS